MVAFYNEIDPYCAEWLRNLILCGEIPDGIVDERPIQQLDAWELAEYDQCHFFAGLGGWPHALRLAGWPDDRPVWTGSCPCQPFSIAGKQNGFADERHLWPVWFSLIRECRPPVLFGEQVAAAKIWLDGVYTDLEAEGYAVGAAVLPACAVNAPHRRDRLWFVADPSGWRWDRREIAADRHFANRQKTRREESADRFEVCNYPSLADTNCYNGYWGSGPLQVGWNCIAGQVKTGSDTSRTQWRIGPGVSLLAHGVSNRVAKLRAFGNAIVPQVAAAFIQAYLEARA